MCAYVEMMCLFYRKARTDAILTSTLALMGRV